MSRNQHDHGEFAIVNPVDFDGIKKQQRVARMAPTRCRSAIPQAFPGEIREGGTGWRPHPSRIPPENGRRGFNGRRRGLHPGYALAARIEEHLKKMGFEA